MAKKCPVKGRLYRGTGLTKQPFRSNPFYWSGFTSTTRNLSVAESFSNEIIIFEQCQFSADISCLSKFPAEEEILLLPYEQFQVISTKKTRRDTIYFESTSEKPLLMGDTEDNNYDGGDNDDGGGGGGGGGYHDENEDDATEFEDKENSDDEEKQRDGEKRKRNNKDDDLEGDQKPNKYRYSKVYILFDIPQVFD